jgi:hypothetical protein
MLSNMNRGGKFFCVIGIDIQFDMVRSEDQVNYNSWKRIKYFI